MKIRTGIDILDNMLDGGIEQKTNVLIMAEPGVEDLQFVHQCLFTHLKNKGNAIYIVNNKKPDVVNAMLDRFDWNIDQFTKKGTCVFLDGYSSLMIPTPKEANIINNPSDIKELSESLSKVLDDMGDSPLLVLDSLSSLIDITDAEEDVLDFMKKLTSELKERNTTFLALFTIWPYEEKTIKNIESMFDCVIKLKAIEQKVILHSYFSVEQKDKKKEARQIPYKIVNPGGVKVFMPKILITGPFNAGKTSFIHSVSTKAVSVDRLGTTVALDHGHVEFKGFSVDLFGTPGQERFDPLMEHLGGEALGVIIVVDSTEPKGFARVKDLLKRTKTEGLPAIIVANKADLKEALSPEEIRKKINLPEEILIIPVTAEDIKKVEKNKPCQLDRNDTSKVLEKLFRKII